MPMISSTLPSYAKDAGYFSSRVPARLAHFVLLALVVLSITAPAITLNNALPWFKIEQLALPFLFLVYFWLVLTGRARLIRLNVLMVIGTIYSLCIGISIVYGSVLLEHPILLRDLYEIPKAFLPVVFFTLSLEAELSESALRNLVNLLSGALLLICAYAWAQWFDLGVAHVLRDYYSGGEHIDGALAHYRRVYSTMGNPNLLGQLMTWSIVGFTMAALFGIGNRFRNLALALVCMITLVMTGSRYGLLNTALGLALIFTLPSLLTRRRLASMACLLLLFPLFAWAGYAVANGNRSTFERLQTLRAPLQADSLRDRLDDLWRDAGDEFFRSPLFGHGPAKIIFTGVFTDSEYLDVLKEFGIMGFMAYLPYFFVPLYFLRRGLRVAARTDPSVESEIPATFWALRLSFIMVVTALVMNIGMSTFYNQALQAYLWMWMGIGVSCAYSIARRQAASLALSHEAHAGGPHDPADARV